MLSGIDVGRQDQIGAFVQAYKFAKRQNAFNGLMPCDGIVKCWANEPNSCILNPNHHMPGPNTN